MTNKEIFIKRYPKAQIWESQNFVEIAFEGEKFRYLMPIEWWNDEVFYVDHSFGEENIVFSNEEG